MKPLLLTIITLFLFACTKHERNKEEDPENVFDEKAYEFLDKGQKDSAFYYFDKARQEYLSQGDSTYAVYALINMAITQQESGDYFGSQETSIQALAFLNENKKKDHPSLAIIYNNLGNVSDRLEDDVKAIGFFEKALFFERDSVNAAVYQNNLALCYRGAGKYSEAIQLFEESLKKSIKGGKEYARTLTNIARTRELQNPDLDLKDDYYEAMAIRKSLNDSAGLNSSYYYLTKYYEKRNVDSALSYANKRYKIAVQLKMAGDKIDGLKQLINLTTSDQYKHYFKDLNYLQDSVDNARLAARNQFALIRYEVEKSKSENLQLQKDKAEVSYKLTWFRLGFILVLISLLLGYLAHRKHRKRMALEAENQIKANKLKTSKKVHDVVANGIYRVMMDIEHKEDLDRDGILDRLELMYNQSRDISHDKDVESQDLKYNVGLAALLTSFSSSSCRVLLVGNDEETWNGLNRVILFELKTSLQELMVNMCKHSLADTVIVKFSRVDNLLLIYYKDNGQGMRDESILGKGLENTVSRIESLNGDITFESEKGNGLAISIKIPVC